VSSTRRPVASRAAHTTAQPRLYPVYVLLRRDLMAVNLGGVLSGSGIHSGHSTSLRR
jgi:hypothetical protein